MVPSDLIVATPFVEVLEVWAISTMRLLLKILGIIMAIMITLESLKSLGWLEYLPRFLKRIMRGLGLSNRTAMLWVTAVVFGLMYGGAVIIEEAKKEPLTEEELERLHISIGISHSLVEDTVLFLALGLNGFWLLVPRLVMAVIVVQICRAVKYLREKSVWRWMVRSR